MSFPSLLTASSTVGSSNSSDQENTTTTANDDDDQRDDPKIAVATFQQRVTHFIHNAYWYVVVISYFIDCL